jgi:hypothetical protein
MSEEAAPYTTSKRAMINSGNLQILSETIATQLAEIKATQRLHSCMLATNTVLLVAILGKLLF